MTRFDSKALQAQLQANPDLRVIGESRLRPEPRRRGRPRELESQMQRAVIAECNRRAEYDPRWGMVLSIPNGGVRNKATAGRMKAEGVKAGVPDLFLACPSRGYAGAFIELKVGRNRAGPRQRGWIEALCKHGYFVMVIFDDPEKVIQILEWYLESEVA